MSISQDQNPIETGLGARPEPDEILSGIDLRGKNALVTGGYSGIGLETTRALVKAGAHVHVPARRPETAQAALEGIIDGAHIGAMDLGDLRSVEKFADDFLSQHDRLDILIGNAGIMACPFETTAQGFESQIGVNHFGHFTLVKKLMPALEKAGKPMARAWSYYPQSATALPLLILTICILPAAITINGSHMAVENRQSFASG